MKSWIQASRPLAHVNIAVPLILGQVAAWHVTARFSWRWFAAAFLWGLLDHLFVIFSNDFADREADSVRRTILSGGSGVIAEGRLTPHQVKRAARGAALSLMVYSCWLAVVGRGWTPVYGLAAILLMWLYSFPPVRLSYRGGGELLQGNWHGDRSSIAWLLPTNRRPFRSWMGHLAGRFARSVQQRPHRPTRRRRRHTSGQENLARPARRSLGSPFWLRRHRLSRHSLCSSGPQGFPWRPKQRCRLRRFCPCSWPPATKSRFMRRGGRASDSTSCWHSGCSR